MSIWNAIGDEEQNELVARALAACDFPFEELRPSLAKEGKQVIRVEWDDLTRFNHTDGAHDHADGAHLIVRDVAGRSQVLGLFYLPPFTRVVLDNFLVDLPLLAQEVFLAEGAHAVDYHYMKDRGLRVAVWNALHDDHEHVDHVTESDDLDHGHSWFDGPGGYSTWVGESFMAAFIKAFAPTIPVTIELDHPVSNEAAREIRNALMPPLSPAEPAPEPTPAPDSEPELEPTPEPTPPAKQRRPWWRRLLDFLLSPWR